MRYIEERDVIEVALEEFVAIARRRVASVPTRDEDEPIRRHPTRRSIESALCGAEALDIRHAFEFGEWRFEIISGAAYENDGHIYLAAELDGERTSPDRELERQCRAEAFILGYIYATAHGLSDILLTLIYNNSAIKSTNEIEERVNIRKLKAFFEKCRISVGIYARPEAERVRDRLPTLKSLRFPYPEIRDGQRSFIHEAYRTIARGGSLIAGAPTGTGKTVSALYPALRAYGAGKCDKIFYYALLCTCRRKHHALIRRTPFHQLREPPAALRCEFLSQ